MVIIEQVPRLTSARVKSSSSGCNSRDSSDLHLLTGLPAPRAAFGLAAPCQPVLGQQVAGQVVAVGEGVSGYAAGDRSSAPRQGSLAEFAVADVATVATTRSRSVMPRRRRSGCRV